VESNKLRRERILRERVEVGGTTEKLSQPEVMGCSLDPVFVAPKHCAWYIFPLGGHRATIEGPEGRVNFEDPK
jgi:hypothetical protein